MSTCKDSTGDTWEIYMGADGHRWRRTAANGRIVGAATQGYANRQDCIDNATRNGMSCEPS